MKSQAPQHSVRDELAALDPQLASLYLRTETGAQSSGPSLAHLHKLGEATLARLAVTIPGAEADDHRQTNRRMTVPNAPTADRNESMLRKLPPRSIAKSVRATRPRWWAAAAAILVLLVLGLAFLRPGITESPSQPLQVNRPLDITPSEELAGGAGLTGDLDPQIDIPADPTDLHSANPTLSHSRESGASSPNATEVTSVRSLASASPSTTARRRDRREKIRKGFTDSVAIEARWTSETLPALAAWMAPNNELLVESDVSADEAADFTAFELTKLPEERFLDSLLDIGDRAVFEWLLDEETVATFYGESTAWSDF